MSTPIAAHPQNQALWRTELAQLLAQPLSVERRSVRQGKALGLRVSPIQSVGRETVDLVISLFFPCLSLPNAEESNADEVALQVFLRGLQNADPRIRAAACEALGQLGDSAARDALLTAANEKDQYVRVAAARALTALDIPRGRKEDLGGVRLLLWRQVRHLWKPLGTATTDRHGRARFANIPADARCRLHGLPLDRQPHGGFAAHISPASDSGKLAAEDHEMSTQSLPHTQELAVEGGSLLCTLYRNDQEDIVVEFRSDAPQLQTGWVHFQAVNANTQETVVSEFVSLQPERRGVSTARLVLTTLMDLQQEHELRFEPLPALPTAQEGKKTE